MRLREPALRLAPQGLWQALLAPAGCSSHSRRQAQLPKPAAPLPKEGKEAKWELATGGQAAEELLLGKSARHFR